MYELPISRCDVLYIFVKYIILYIAKYESGIPQHRTLIVICLIQFGETIDTDTNVNIRLASRRIKSASNERTNQPTPWLHHLQHHYPLCGPYIAMMKWSYSICNATTILNHYLKLQCWPHSVCQCFYHQQVQWWSSVLFHPFSHSPLRFNRQLLLSGRSNWLSSNTFILTDLCACVHVCMCVCVLMYTFIWSGFMKTIIFFSTISLLYHRNEWIIIRNVVNYFIQNFVFIHCWVNHIHLKNISFVMDH